MKIPAIQFYPGDWLRDDISGCTLAAQGLWLRMMFLMHDAKPYGYLSINGAAMRPDFVARRCGVDPDQYATLLAELDATGVPSRSPSGIIYSRRMVKDAKKRKESQKDGRMGGNPKLGVNYNHPGFVYLMKRADGLVKIGISKSPENRMYKLRQACSDPSISIIAKHATDDMGRDEAHLQAQYGEFKVDGEWFRLTDTHIKDLSDFFSLKGKPKGVLKKNTEEEVEEKKEEERLKGETVSVVTEQHRATALELFDRWSRLYRGKPLMPENNEHRAIFSLLEDVSTEPPILQGSQQVRQHLLVPRAIQFQIDNGKDFEGPAYACKSIRGVLEKWALKGMPGAVAKNGKQTAKPDAFGDAKSFKIKA